MVEAKCKPCLLCGTTTISAWILGKNKKIYWACANCQFIYLDSDFYLTSDLEKQRYLKHDNDFSSPDYQEYVGQNLAKIDEFFLAAFKKMVKPKEDIRILDFGCGRDPVLAKELEKHGYQVCIYDPFFFNDKQYLNKKYDLILMIEVIEHLAQPLQTLMEVRNLLKPQGSILIRTEPATYDKMFFANWWYPRDTTHISFFNSHSTQVLAEKIGCRVTFSEGSFFILQ